MCYVYVGVCVLYVGRVTSPFLSEITCGIWYLLCQVSSIVRMGRGLRGPLGVVSVERECGEMW